MAFREKSSVEILEQAVAYSFACRDLLRGKPIGSAFNMLPADMKERLKDLRSEDTFGRRVLWGDRPTVTKVFRLK